MASRRTSELHQSRSSDARVRAAGDRRLAGQAGLERLGGSRGGGEFALIDAFLAPFGLDRSGQAGARSVLIGPGDDCAALLPTPGQVLVATTDAALDGVHFDLARCTPEDAGWKALAVNLSDLAAAGAVPRFVLCALGVPKVEGAARIAAGLGRGMAALLSRSGGALVGGNLTRSPVWSITITALGESPRPLSRAGGRPGDALVLAGTLGAAALGLQLLQQRPGRRPEMGARARQRKGLTRSERAAVEAQLRPVPLLAAGLAARALASAAIDVSDGLLQDASHLCKRSGCGAVLDCGLLPRSQAVAAADARLAREGGHPFALSLSGGEEYALLFSVRRRRLPRLLQQLERAGSPGAVIGALEPGAGVRLVEGERPIDLPLRAGFDHLA
jgi:thiamine-monophosphate kinase